MVDLYLQLLTQPIVMNAISWLGTFPVTQRSAKLPSLRINRKPELEIEKLRSYIPE